MKTNLRVPSQLFYLFIYLFEAYFKIIFHNCSVSSRSKCSSVWILILLGLVWTGVDIHVHDKTMRKVVFYYIDTQCMHYWHLYRDYSLIYSYSIYMKNRVFCGSFSPSPVLTPCCTPLHHHHPADVINSSLQIVMSNLEKKKKPYVWQRKVRNNVWKYSWRLHECSHPLVTSQKETRQRVMLSVLLCMWKRRLHIQVVGGDNCLRVRLLSHMHMDMVGCSAVSVSTVLINLNQMWHINSIVCIEDCNFKCICTNTTNLDVIFTYLIFGGDVQFDEKSFKNKNLTVRMKIKLCFHSIARVIERYKYTFWHDLSAWVQTNKQRRLPCSLELHVPPYWSRIRPYASSSAVS